MFHSRYILLYFVFLFLMYRSNPHHLGIFVIVSLGLFIIIIFISIFFIHYTHDHIIVLRGVIYEVDDILSELPGDEGVGIFVLIPHGRLAYGHPSPIPYSFPINISTVDGIDDTINIILELEDPILLQYIGFALLVIFLVVVASQSLLM